jgi:hypothetical protein
MCHLPLEYNNVGLHLNFGFKKLNENHMTGKKTKLPLYFLSLHRTEQTSHARTLKRRRVRSSLRRPKARPQQRWARSAASGSTRSGQGWTRECSTQSGQGGRAERSRRSAARAQWSRRACRAAKARVGGPGR